MQPCLFASPAPNPDPTRPAVAQPQGMARDILRHLARQSGPESRPDLRIHLGSEPGPETRTQPGSERLTLCPAKPRTHNPAQVQINLASETPPESPFRCRNQLGTETPSHYPIQTRGDWGSHPRGDWVTPGLAELLSVREPGRTSQLLVCQSLSPRQLIRYCP